MHAVLGSRRQECAAGHESDQTDQRVTRAHHARGQHAHCWPTPTCASGMTIQEPNASWFILARVTLPNVGKPAPDFTLPSTDDTDVTLSSFKGKRAVVLYFYPKDDTPGCTKEACSFRDLRSLFNEHGAEILGVSADTVKSHKKFRDKFHLTFPLLADTDHAVADQYGVWQLKKFMGREYMGIARTTFVVDKNGTIKAVFPNVKVEGHADKVLEALKD